jgi:hypothetical protein
VRPLVLWNFGPKAPMPRWGWEIEQAEDLDKKLNRDKILQGMGLPYTKEYLSRTYEVPLPQAGETVVGPNPNTPDIPADPDAEDVTFAELRDQARVSSRRRAGGF